MSLEALLQKLDYEPAQLGGVRTYLQHLLGGADLALVQAEDFKKNKLNEVKPVGLRSRLRAALHADPEASAAVTTAAPSLSVTAYAKDMASLRQVILLTRHGARFPISPYFGNQNWPGNMPDFWGTYKGNLTPVGVNDHIRNGAQFKEHYVDRLKLVDPKGLLSDTVFCRSTNTQRTILSAWSLLMAMFPKSCIRLEVDNDTQQKWVDNPDITDDDATVTIHVNLSLKEDTTKLKSHKTEQSKEAHWQDLKKHPVFQKWADDPKIKTLLDKIYEMTQESKLSPELQMIKRLKKAYVVHTNVVIDDYHGMLVLRNPKGLLLSPEEKQQFAQISHRTWQVKWTGGNPIRQKEIAVGTKSFLQQHFFKHMDDFVNKKTKNKFVYYSNHDGLVAASMSAMNVFNWDVPGFASYVILELHEPSPGKFEVGFKYNPSPIDIPLTGVPSLQLALEPTAIEHLKPGRIPLETFRKICFGN